MNHKPQMSEETHQYYNKLVIDYNFYAIHREVSLRNRNFARAAYIKMEMNAIDDFLDALDEYYE